MAQIQLAVQTRPTGKGSARALRREGFVPAILYGPERDSLPLQVEEKDLRRALTASTGGTIIAELQVHGDDEPHYVMVKDIQVHPLRRELLHVDFHEISLTDVITFNVPIIVTGEESVASRGGVAQQLIRDVEVECLPNALPDQFNVDVSELNIGDQITVADLDVSEGVTLLTTEAEIVVTVTLPRTIEEEEPEVDEELEEGEEGEEEATDEEAAEAAESEEKKPEA